jgi:hypothetical protein
MDKTLRSKKVNYAVSNITMESYDRNGHVGQDRA